MGAGSFMARGAARAFLLLAFAVTAAAAQPDRLGMPISARAATESLRRAGHPGPAASTLRQARGPLTQGASDDLADSLAAFVLTYAGDERYASAASLALDALGAAGVQRGEGVPYGGAGERLLRIAMQPRGGLRGGALYYVSQLADPEDAIRLLTVAATSTDEADDVAAYQAVGHLMEFLGARGASAVQDLYRTDAIRSPSARRQVEAWARIRGWTRDSLRWRARRGGLD